MSSKRRKSAIPVRHLAESAAESNRSSEDSYICGHCQTEYQSLWAFLAHKRTCDYILEFRTPPSLQELARLVLVEHGNLLNPTLTLAANCNADLNFGGSEGAQSLAVNRISTDDRLKSPGPLRGINIALMTMQQQQFLQMQILQQIHAHLLSRNALIPQNHRQNHDNPSILSPPALDSAYLRRQDSSQELKSPVLADSPPSNTSRPERPSTEEGTSSSGLSIPRPKSAPCGKVGFGVKSGPLTRPSSTAPKSSSSDPGNFPLDLSGASSIDDVDEKQENLENAVTPSMEMAEFENPTTLQHPSSQLSQFLQQAWAYRMQQQFQHHHHHPPNSVPLSVSGGGLLSRPPTFEPGTSPKNAAEANKPPAVQNSDDDWESLMEVTVSDEADKISQIVNQLGPSGRVNDPNQCVICKRVLSCKSALQMHYRTHTGERPFKCKICLRAFTTKGNLKTHMGVHRIKAPTKFFHSCPICQKKFTNSTLLQQHIRNHNGAISSLPLQRSHSWQKPELTLAIPSSTLASPVPANQEPLDMSPSRKQHDLAQSCLETIDSIRRNQSVPPASAEQISPPDPPAFSGLALPHGNPFDKVIFPSAQAVKIVNGRSNTTCNVCFKTFACHSALDIHYRSHTKERPFKCRICGRGFTTKGNMKQHLLTHKIRDMSEQGGSRRPEGSTCSTNGISRNGSSICSEDTNSREDRDSPSPMMSPSQGSVGSFSGNDSILIDPDSQKERSDTDPLREIERMWKTASEESSEPNSAKRPRPNLSKHQCHVCFKHFSSASALQIHMRTHTGDKPFKCDICERAFTTKGNLKVHMGTHVWNNCTIRRGRRMNEHGVPEPSPSPKGPGQEPGNPFQGMPPFPRLHFPLPGPPGGAFPSLFQFPPGTEIPSPATSMPGIKIEPLSSVNRPTDLSKDKNSASSSSSQEEPSPVEESPTVSTPAAVFSPPAFDSPFRSSLPPFLPPNFLSPIPSSAGPVGFPGFFRFPGQGFLPGYPFNFSNLIPRHLTAEHHLPSGSMES